MRKEKQVWASGVSGHGSVHLRLEDLGRWEVGPTNLRSTWATRSSRFARLGCTERQYQTIAEEQEGWKLKCLAWGFRPAPSCSFKKWSRAHSQVRWVQGIKHRWYRFVLYTLLPIKRTSRPCFECTSASELGTDKGICKIFPGKDFVTPARTQRLFIIINS